MVIPTVEKDIVLIGGMTFHLCHMAKAMSESWRSTVMDGGISKRLCGPLVAVGAMCCVRAFRDVLLKHEKHRHGYICTKQPARIAALQL